MVILVLVSPCPLKLSGHSIRKARNVRTSIEVDIFRLEGRRFVFDFELDSAERDELGFYQPEMVAVRRRGSVQSGVCWGRSGGW